MLIQIVEGLGLLPVLWMSSCLPSSKQLGVSRWHNPLAIIRLIICLHCLGYLLYTSEMAMDHAERFLTTFYLILMNLLTIPYLALAPTTRKRYIYHLICALLVCSSIPSIHRLWMLFYKSSNEYSLLEFDLEMFVAAVLIPLFTPQHYDMASNHPEMMCSPISKWWTYQWVDQIIINGYKRAEFIDQTDILPLRAESSSESLYYDFSDEFQANSHNLLLAILKIQKKRLVIMFIFLFLCSVMEFLSPLGLNLLLKNIGLPANADAVRPAFCIAMFSLAPIIRGLCMQSYELYSTRMVSHVKGMVISSLFHKKMYGETSWSLATNDDFRGIISVDIDKVCVLRYTFMALVMVPTEFATASYLMYKTLGWAYFPGLVLLILSRLWLAHGLNTLTSKAQANYLENTDARLARTSELLDSLLSTRLMGFGQAIVDRIFVDRDNELKGNTRKLFTNGAIEGLSTLFLVLPMAISLGLFSIVRKQSMTPDVIFTSAATFSILKSQSVLMIAGVSCFSQASLSLRRVQQALIADMAVLNEVGKLDTVDCTSIKLDNATLLSPRGEVIFENSSLEFKEKGLNVICAPTGSGKSTFLLALLGEHPFIKGVAITPKLHRSYAPQIPFIENMSVRDNILFGSPYKEDKYRDILRICSLDYDVGKMELGDLTLAGEKGDRLSGGQRQRINLARALYADSSVVFLDDILSSLDANTTKDVVDKYLITNPYKQTIVLVSSNRTCLENADLVCLLKDGKIETVTTFGEELFSSIENDKPSSDKNPVTATEEEVTEEEYHKDDSSTLQDAKEGYLQHSSFLWIKYMRYFGSPLYLMSLAACLAAAQGLDIMLSFWLSLWTESPLPESSPKFLIGYITVGAIQALVATLGVLLLINGAWRASSKIHANLLNKVYRASTHWITATPVGQIMNIFSGDLRSVDDDLVSNLRPVLEVYLSIGLRIISLATVIPSMLVPVLIVLAIAVTIGNIYITASTNIKGLYLRSISPLLTSFDSLSSGITVIKTFRAQKGAWIKLISGLDNYLQAWQSVYDCQRWLAVHMDMCASSVCLISSYCAWKYVDSIDLGQVGFSLVTTNGLCTSLLYLVYTSSLLEIELKSYQRVEHYIDSIPQESDVEKEDCMQVPVDWPKQGSISVHDLTLSYSPEGSNIVKNVSLQASSGQSIGIVGRSGSGKSTLATSLVRLPHIKSGKLLVDGIDVTDISTDTLRSRISLVPQNPQLFQGTVGFNLDPLKTVPYDCLQQTLNSIYPGLSLENLVTKKGSNFSLGQKQLLCIVRAIVSGCKIIVLDEATSSLDTEMEKTVVKAMKSISRDDHLTIIVAHRLNLVIDCDMIYVLDDGRILERGSPAELIQANGIFKGMCEAQGLVETATEISK